MELCRESSGKITLLSKSCQKGIAAKNGHTPERLCQIRSISIKAVDLLIFLEKYFNFQYCGTVCILCVLWCRWC